ncbi:Transglutaminase-like superfamily protein [bacterium A37T11]|nr:Transglutaminase-like superfamily protein [bacterium A37T11]
MKAITFFKGVCMQLACSVALVSVAKAQDLAISNIPQAFRDSADVVKRFEDIRFEVNSPVSTVLKRRYALSILNENGAEYANIKLYFSKLSAIKSLSGILYDANGKEVRKIKGRDFTERSAVGNGNLMDDNRVISYNLLNRTYPYTIVYTYEQDANNSLFYEDWMPVEGDRFAVLQSKFSLVHPTDQPVRYKTFSYTGDPVKTMVKGKESLSWEIKNFRPTELQILSPPHYELFPTLFTGPETFAIEGYTGNMHTWQDFGKFVASLTAGRDQLPERVKGDVHRLTDALPNDKDKIKALYQYLQHNTRYVSIQLGLGGWQPYDAAYVAANSYGDCKALVNYMYSLLREAGISSHYTLVRAGDHASPIITDMPSSQFNHVILAALPKGSQDTVWLECTSQTTPCGYLGSFTCNRDVLLIDPAYGGKLIHTPSYKLTDNLQTRHVQAILKEDDQLQMEVNTVYTGQQQERVHDLISNLPPDKVKEQLNEAFDLSTYDVASFKHTEKDSLVPKIEETLKINVQNYATITGKRLFIQPNVLTKGYRRLPDEIRRFPIKVPFPYLDTDSVQIKLPAGYELEAMPENVALNSKFGSYDAQFKVSDNTITYYRRISHSEGGYPASDYASLRKFYDDIYKADRSRMVFVKKAE